MKLPLPFFQSKNKEEAEYYLALLLTDEKACAVILHESLGNLKILGKHEEFFSYSIETLSTEDLLNVVDKAISRAEEILPPDIETHKTVFGVKDDWVDETSKKIKKDNLSKLKKVCDALDLMPIGFMVTTEAIANRLQEEEGAPLSAILAEVGNKKITLTLLRGGKIAERIDGEIAESMPKTVDTLLRHFTATVLPARIILYDGKDAEKLSQAFIGHQWSKSLPFLHVPQISVLPQGFDGKAVAYGASEQMGFALLEEKQTLHHVVTEEGEKEAEQTITDEEEKIDEEELPVPKETALSGDNFGFLEDQDISTKIKKSEAKADEVNLHEAHHNIAPVEGKFPFQINLQQDEGNNEEKPNIFAFMKNLKLPKIPLPSLLTGKRPFILPIIVLAAIVIIGSILSYVYFYKTQAQIVISVKPKLVDQSADVIFSKTSPSDFSKNIIAAKAISTTVDGSLTIDTTGKKDVGNKAKGTVTIYNNSDSSVNLDNGTTIKSSNGLTFSTDKSVTVASASGDVFSGTKPGTSDVAVTAKDIGTESNLPSGTKFTIGSNSSLAAKNDSAFSGGTKKQVQVVSKNDIAKLKTELPKSLEGKAKDAISQKADSSTTLLPTLTVASLNKTNFDNNTDDEAKKVKLTASVVFEGLAYENDELTNYAKTLLKDKYSQDISDKSIKNSIEDANEKNDSQIEAKLTIEAGLLPDINTQDVTNKIKDMSAKAAQEYLANLPQVANSKITFSPGIPFLSMIFPKLPNNITVEIKPE